MTILIESHVMNLFQVLSVSILTLSIIRLVYQYRLKHLNIIGLAFWGAVWILGIVVILSPEFTFTLSRIFGIERGADLIIYSSIVIAYVLGFSITQRIGSLEEKLKDLNTKISLESFKKQKNDV